ncbi:MAG TPA: hypothetical protein VF275_02935 [Gammaproteobacteria bacterium]
MNLKKLILTGAIILLTSPFAFADEIGTGKTGDSDSTTNSTTMATAADEIGTGTPTASDEIGTGSEMQAMLAWWDILLRSF